MIETFDLTKNYGGFTAVNRLNLHVRSGEIYGFLGPNGAGKTTTIRMITGLLRPTLGKVFINGVDIWQEPIKAKAQIGLIPDTPSVYPKLSGNEFLDFIASIYELPRKESRWRIAEILEMLDLTHKADELIATYSHGMKQKIIIAAALLHDPSVLILDEPTVGLDPKSAKLIKDLLRAFALKGKTVFMSTHILEMSERMCDRVGIINYGELIAEGTIEELRNKVGKGEGSLEDLFLERIGGEDIKNLLKFLED